MKSTSKIVALVVLATLATGFKSHCLRKHTFTTIHHNKFVQCQNIPTGGSELQAKEESDCFEKKSLPIKKVILGSFEKRISQVQQKLSEESTSDAPRGMVFVPSSASQFEIFTPRLVDLGLVTALLRFQVALVIVGAVLAWLLNINLIWDIGYEYITVGAIYGLMVATIGIVVDMVPWRPFQKLTNGTRFFVLRMLGRETNAITAAFIAAIVSLGAAISEETMFRGLILPTLANAFTPSFGLAISSLAFGLAHYPVWGSSTAIETLLGGAFGWL